MKRRKKKPTRPTFEEYAEQHAKDAAHAVAFLETKTELLKLERFTLKLAYVLNHSLIDLPNSKKGQAIRVIIVKITHEVFSFCGALRAGSLDGGWHHLRTLIEVRAALHYLFADRNETATRLEQFFEFGDLALWQRRRLLDEQLQQGKITPLQYQRRNLISDALFARITEDILKHWRTIWNKTNAKLATLKHWHLGPISSLIEAVDTKNELNRAYEVLCHGIHVSPLGHRLANNPGPRTLGFESDQAVRAIYDVLSYMYPALRQIDLALDKKLLNHLEKELLAFEAFKEFEKLM
jgi:hypothetical protein